MPVIERSTSYSAVSCSAFLLCVARGELRCLTYTYLLAVIYVHPRSIKQGYKFGQLGMRRGTHFPKRRHLRRRVNLLPRRSAFEDWVLLGFLPPPDWPGSLSPGKICSCCHFYLEANAIVLLQLIRTQTLADPGEQNNGKAVVWSSPINLQPV